MEADGEEREVGWERAGCVDAGEVMDIVMAVELIKDPVQKKKINTYWTEK